MSSVSNSLSAVVKELLYFTKKSGSFACVTSEVFTGLISSILGDSQMLILEILWNYEEDLSYTNEEI